MAILPDEISNFVQEVHILASDKGTLFRGPSATLPFNGIYVFFEESQKIMIKSKEYSRIVRIGINEKPNNFPNRIRGHYKGNIEGSVFRENIGWALLELHGKKPHETYKTKSNYRKQNSGGPLEREISDYFSKAFTFKAFRISYDELATYERILIGAFSIYYQDKLLKGELDLRNWLGLRAYSRQNRIKRSGLWNSERVILIDHRFSTEKIEMDKLTPILRDLTQNIV